MSPTTAALCASLPFFLDNALDLEVTSFDGLLCVVPSTTGVRETNCNLNARNDSAGEQAADSAGSEQEAHSERGGNDEDAWSNHLLKRSLS